MFAGQVEVAVHGGGQHVDGAAERQIARCGGAVIGVGVAGGNAVAIAVGMHADVTVLDLDISRLRDLDARYGGRIRTITSNALEVETAVRDADMVIGAVLVPGSKAPTLVSNDLVAQMKPGAVLVDIAIDQGAASRIRD